MLNEQIEDLLNLADEAKNEGSYNIALHYYKSVLEQIPNNWEANIYFKIISNIPNNENEIEYAINNLINILNNVPEKIKANITEPELQKYFCTDIAVLSAKFAYHICGIQNEHCEKLINQRTYYTRLSPVGFIKNTMVPRYKKLAQLLYDFGDDLENTFKIVGLDGAITAWESGNKILQFAVSHLGFAKKQHYKRKISQYKRRIKINNALL